MIDADELEDSRRRLESAREQGIFGTDAMRVCRTCGRWQWLVLLTDEICIPCWMRIGNGTLTYPGPVE